MKDLDDPSSYAVDPGDFLAVVEGFPSQLRAGWDLGSEVEGLPQTGGIDSIAVLGMGGSGISGDFLQIALDGSVFAATVKGYDLPSWVGSSTLVFAVSYSGNTEETLETFSKALRAGSPAVAVTTGGRLAEMAGAEGVPVITVPGGLQPRAALGYLMAPMLAVAERMKLGSFEEQVARAVSQLERRSKELSKGVPVESNPAKHVATGLAGKIPIVFGSEGPASVAAYRLKCQLNECSKVPAYSALLPELDHNEIVGFSQLRTLTSSALSLVLLRHDAEHPRISKRFQVTRGLIEEHFGSVYEMWGEGGSDLEIALDLTLIGDFVATYLAIVQGVDPSPVAVIASLKKQLAD